MVPNNNLNINDTAIINYEDEAL